MIMLKKNLFVCCAPMRILSWYWRAPQLDDLRERACVQACPSVVCTSPTPCVIRTTCQSRFCYKLQASPADLLGCTIAVYSQISMRCLTMGVARLCHQDLYIAAHILIFLYFNLPTASIEKVVFRGKVLLTLTHCPSRKRGLAWDILLDWKMDFSAYMQCTSI